jgi:hypothetical protein
MFELTQLVNDETAVRAAAYDRIRAAAHHGLAPVWEKVHVMERRLSTLGALRDTMLAVDPDRAPAFARHDAELRRRFDAIPQGPFGQRVVIQPIRVNLLRKAA